MIQCFPKGSISGSLNGSFFWCELWSVKAVKLGVGRVLEKQSELQHIKLGNKLKKKHL